MKRLCERPGCSENASVSYGLVADDRVFWLDAHAGDLAQGGRGLCRRHADSMVVPIGWTLDDRRDPDLHLFRPPAAESAEKPRSPRRARTDDGTEQLTLDDEPVPVPALDDDAEEGADLDAWTPSFDTDDDLDGLLSAKSPLLSRAFRGDSRPRR
jgi:hypothetical protein